MQRLYLILKALCRIIDFLIKYIHILKLNLNELSEGLKFILCTWSLFFGESWGRWGLWLLFSASLGSLLVASKLKLNLKGNDALSSWRFEDLSISARLLCSSDWLLDFIASSDIALETETVFMRLSSRFVFIYVDFFARL